MTNFINYILRLYEAGIYHPILSLVKFLGSNLTWFSIFIVIFVVLIALRRKIKSQNLGRIANVLAVLIFVILMLTVYDSYSKEIVAFVKKNITEVKPTTNTTTTPKSNTQTTPTQTAPQNTYTVPQVKQLYYAVSCYSCWNEACPRNGYSYGGYTESIYQYYYQICKSCSCNSFKAQSLWR